MRILPSAGAIVASALAALAGAVLTAWVVGRSPRLRAWMRAQWGDPPR